jgi:hypothetical protein
MSPTIDEIVDLGAEIKLVDADAKRLKEEGHERLRQADKSREKAEQLRGRLRSMVEAFQTSPNEGTSAPLDHPADAPGEDDSERATVMIDQIKAWFDAHPNDEVRAKDVHAAGIGKTADSLRSSLHRLVNDGFLAQPGTGLFKLAPQQRPAAPATKGFISFGRSTT